MTENALSQSAVSVLADYLRRKAEVGPAAYSAPLENLQSLIESKFSANPLLGEIFARFVDNPSGPVEAEALRLYLAQEVKQDSGFSQHLRSILVDQQAKGGKSKVKRGRWALVAVGTAVALIAGFVLARVTAPQTIQTSSPATTTVTVTPAPPETTTPSSPTVSSTSATTDSSVVPTSPGIAGDGSSVSKGAPVLLVNLPRPNDEWDMKYGDHDVQLTQFTNSLWNMLATCNSSSYRGEQVFRLKNFTRLEVKSVGTDSTADPRLAVKFEVFVNDDDVNAKQTVVVNPGEAKPLAVDLPPGTFAVKLRTSLATATGSPCRSGNAVWGSPYVIAAGR